MLLEGKDWDEEDEDEEDDDEDPELTGVEASLAAAALQAKRAANARRRQQVRVKALRLYHTVHEGSHVADVGPLPSHLQPLPAAMMLSSAAAGGSAIHNKQSLDALPNRAPWHVLTSSLLRCTFCFHYCRVAVGS